MRILVITDYLPYPLIGGDRIRIYNLLLRVAYRHEVSLVGFLEKPDDVEGIAYLREFCARVEAINPPQRSYLTRLLGMIWYALTAKPMELYLLHSKELFNKIQQLASTSDFDIIQVEHSRMGLYLKAFPPNRRCKSLLMFHNFTYQQYDRVAHIERNWYRKLRSFLNGIAMLKWEPRYAERFDRCVTVSEADKSLLLKANPRLNVNVIPNGVDVHKYQPLPLLIGNVLPSALLFVGNMGYPPCVDAVLYFCGEIFPRILQKIPATELWIVGRDPQREVLRLNSDKVHVTGQVSDVVPYYRQAHVCVVPLRAGGGTRLKILEAMALGRPVVSTTVGCEGLDVMDGEHLVIADSPELFAEKTVSLFTNIQLYRRISMNGRKFVETQCDWNKIADKLTNVYKDVVRSGY